MEDNAPPHTGTNPTATRLFHTGVTNVLCSEVVPVASGHIIVTGHSNGTATATLLQYLPSGQSSTSLTLVEYFHSIAAVTCTVTEIGQFYYLLAVISYLDSTLAFVEVKLSKSQQLFRTSPKIFRCKLTELATSLNIIYPHVLVGMRDGMLLQIPFTRGEDTLTDPVNIHTLASTPQVICDKNVFAINKIVVYRGQEASHTPTQNNPVAALIVSNSGGDVDVIEGYNPSHMFSDIEGMKSRLKVKQMVRLKKMPNDVTLSRVFTRKLTGCKESKTHHSAIGGFISKYHNIIETPIIVVASLLEGITVVELDGLGDSGLDKTSVSYNLLEPIASIKELILDSHMIGECAVSDMAVDETDEVMSNHTVTNSEGGQLSHTVTLPRTVILCAGVYGTLYGVEISKEVDGKLKISEIKSLTLSDGETIKLPSCVYRTASSVLLLSQHSNSIFHKDGTITSFTQQQKTETE